MLRALIHGKLSSEQENMEDILTSNVFGVLQHLPIRSGLWPFITLAAAVDRTRLFEADAAPPEDAAYQFWPWMAERGCIGCEPDLLLRLKWSDGRAMLLLIEAKYKSGKSSEESGDQAGPRDQLAREWDNLRWAALREDAEPALIYLTADLGCPCDEIEVSRRAFHGKRPDASQPFRCFWLSWRHLPPLIEKGGATILHDLKAVLLRMGMRFFDGIAGIAAVAPTR
jgi:hypothetical protein